MAQARDFTLKSYEFRREREDAWAELERLLDRVRVSGLRSLPAGELARLPQLYRATLSSLSVARSISLDKNVVAYLENLTARAYFVVYGTKRQLRDRLGVFVTTRLPGGIRRYRFLVLAAAAMLIFGTLTGYFVTRSDRDRFYAFVSPEYAQGRGPATSTSELRAALYDEGTSGEALATFASFLFTHNAKIGILAFALGFLMGVPVVFLLFTNGLTLGAFAALYHDRGLAVDFWGWILPHGITEMTAVVVCGAAGLVLAQAIIVPARQSRMHSLAANGREAGMLVIGAVAMFFIAAMIEGIFRQTVQSVPARYAVAAMTAVAWIAYFCFVGRRRVVDTELGATR